MLYFASYVVLDPGDSAITGLHYKEIMGEVRYQELRSELGPGAFKAGMGAESVQQLLRDIDLDELSYVSSAGLRVFLRLAKQVGQFKIENASSVVYEVLDMTGFTDMFDVSKAFRRVSIDELDIIGRGAKGAVYRLDPETIVKVIYDTGNEALADISRERELARTAFIAGIPTAISYDVVRVDDHYGAVYELLNASTLAELVASGSWTAERAGKALAEIMAQMHETHVSSDVMPSSRDLQLEAAVAEMLKETETLK